MSSASLRPGAALGFYPERREETDGRLERTLAGALGAAARRVRFGRSGLAKIVDRVAGHADALRARSDAEISALVRELRTRMAGEGLSDELVARSFALVREVSARTVGMRPFDVQIVGGWVILQGMLAEMQTGEGKTLTATLPACSAALAGIPVHVVTANDYLAARDAELMRPVYEALGLTVGTVTNELKDPVQRRAAYACDVTYCTSQQVAFDYLRDRLVLGNARGRLTLALERLHDPNARLHRLLLRGLCFAIVDEADSVLIDEARTPLILSRPVRSADPPEVYGQALSLARRLERGADFQLNERHREVLVTDRGAERVARLSAGLEGPWKDARHREELTRLALSALHLFARDKHYLVRDGKVQIIDQNTGRIMADRSWERGLHQLIEVKENCDVSPPKETLARISYQRFFRRYLRLGGMTGTAREVAGELRSTYGLEVVTVPTHRPMQRQAGPTRVYATTAAKWLAVIAHVRALRARGRPVLVGTCSVAASERLSSLLNRAGLEHELLNARQDQREAEIVARAGEPGRITVATGMAGRGTDIALAPGVAEAGGLHVIATEPGEARRIDRQLFGRCGRQGDPGSYEALLSLEDDLLTLHRPRGPLKLLRKLRRSDRSLARRVGEVCVSRAQRAEERKHARMRRDLLRLEEYLGNVLAFAGSME